MISNRKPLPWRSLSAALRWYIAATAIAACVILAFQAGDIRADPPELFFPVLVTSVVLAATKIRLPLLPSSATVSLSYCINFAALSLFSPFAATFIIAVSVWAQCALNNAGRTATYRTVFSIANIIVATALTHGAAGLVGGLAIRQDWTALVVPTLAGATAFFLCNTLMLAHAVALESKKSPVNVWREQFLWSAPACFVGALVGVSAAHLIEIGSRLAAFVAVPILLFYWGYRTYLGFIEKQEAMHLDTVEALARAIGARDQTLDASNTVSDRQIRRAQRLAVTLARRAGMSEDEVKGVEVATLLHDIGKLAVPEHILNKPTKLTDAERQLIQLHPTAGAKIIGAVDFGYSVAPLIASHHERWDGQGYPERLPGEDIPLGSRVLAVVDYFDALISARPYHEAMPEALARKTIREEGGRALDPRLVKMFLEILETEMPLAAQPDTQLAGAVAARRATDVPAPIDNVLEDIARANTEMGALYGLTEAMGLRLSVSDTMALIALRLSPLVPASAWALFVCDETTGESRCTFASGLDSEVLLGLKVPEGAGTIGYVARLGKPVRNAHPATDFGVAGLPDDQLNLQSVVACPLRVHDRTIGVLAAYHVNANYFTEAHEGTLEKIAPRAAVVVHDAQAFEEVRTAAFTDALTGLNNSRALLVHSEKEMSRADRDRTSWALIVIDVDRFKTINDGFGHPAGDRALQLIGRAISESVGASGFCGRQGGDEFLVVLSERNASQAPQFARNVQEAVGCIRFEAGPGIAVPLSISVGHAVYPTDGRSLAELTTVADDRMYLNKSSRAI